jgi:hypothetical protein
MESSFYSPIESDCIFEEGIYKLIVDKGRAAFGNVEKDHNVIAIMTGLGEHLPNGKRLVDFAGYIKIEEDKDIVVRGDSYSCVNRIENIAEATLHAAEILSGILMKNISTPFTKQT